ncbi:hypothetical protein DFJ58DRAFT_863145 [Suillus subalutaceus]|uniref:uncharacterized protein n=1 Tax=Suillus subalutaceus TaxID=48586 RepID=UPI001B87426D|nr:uncharacterized protein DFJ58DRAFT_863145 [Suillus subalutaceus]KAG1837217.1 hypothetical protein DFJ58DRAFT_863145 [Suillus subalutaceus]
MARQCMGPSFDDAFAVPKELSKTQIKAVVVAFVEVTKRALKAGIDVIEIHNIHGYLLFSFLSPISNTRTDEYGGSFENRIRLILEVMNAIYDSMPQDMPLFFEALFSRFLQLNSSNKRFQQTIMACRRYRTYWYSEQDGVDFLDVSSGASHPKAIIKASPAYQAPFTQQSNKLLGTTLLLGLSAQSPMARPPNRSLTKVKPMSFWLDDYSKRTRGLLG